MAFHAFHIDRRKRMYVYHAFYILPFYDISHLWTCLLMLPRSKTIFTLLFGDFDGCYGGLLLFVYYYLVFVAFIVSFLVGWFLIFWYVVF